ncbi:PVC-type heme-binding CxxCH protein [Prosthecobacter sp.]|uniref:PVC-type heme-binding CxxCH protein n=1 Tax=Prosthecobacter sp. TaxID=1965333 RepID=UPI003783B78B
MKPIATTLASALALCLPGLLPLHAADLVPLNLFTVPEGLEVKLWAAAPLLHNPTSIDTDKDGRLWVTEGVDYGAKHYQTQPGGDRVTVIEDSDGDGTADKSWTFVQEPALRAPLGIAVIDNQVVVSMAPSLIVYTDVNRDMKFDPAVDSRQVLLTGFNGHNHDHGLHSLTVGADGMWYWSMGNCGAVFTDKSGRTFRIGSPYDIRYGMKLDMDPRDFAGQRSDDGHVYLGGFAARMRPDGSQVEIIGHNFRNSYEHTVTSFGDVFQNDNDDPPACRTSFVMLHGSAGYSSPDGRRTWQADRRPGQPVPVAEWRQEDPGVMPAGDVYGGGAPTGIAFYENGALGDKFAGLLLSCEAGRNSIFGYLPKPDGAGFALERFPFLASNPGQAVNSSDFGSRREQPAEEKFSFRPSDVVVGADGAVYVSDWFDPVVGGGHKYLDEAAAGAVYRIAPKGFKPRVPKLDLGTSEGQAAALHSPAVHVRAAAAARLRAQGAAAIPAVTQCLKDDNAFIRARAAWVLADLGAEARAAVTALLDDADPQMRVAAFRALRQQHADVPGLAARLAQDPSPAMRREVALSLRDVPLAQARSIIVTLAQSCAADDRTAIEAFGIGCTGKEAAVFDAVAAVMGGADPLQWTPAFARIAWRLHPPQVVAALETRALAATLPLSDRRAALVALGCIPSNEAAHAMANVAAQAGDPLKSDAVWWLLNRKDDQWKQAGLAERLKRDGIYDPDKVQLVGIQVPPQPPARLPPVSDILRLKGDAKRGQQFAAACLMCHHIKDQGVDYGPDITAYARMQPSEVVLRAMIEPSADISHGFEGSDTLTKDGKHIHGMTLSSGDPLIIRSQGGMTQMVPAAQIQSTKPLGRSLMLSAEQLGLGAQEIADVLAYLKSL